MLLLTLINELWSSELEKAFFPLQKNDLNLEAFWCFLLAFPTAVRFDFYDLAQFGHLICHLISLTTKWKWTISKNV